MKHAMSALYSQQLHYHYHDVLLLSTFSFNPDITFLGIENHIRCLINELW